MRELLEQKRDEIVARGGVLESIEAFDAMEELIDLAEANAIIHVDAEPAAIIQVASIDAITDMVNGKLDSLRTEVLLSVAGSRKATKNPRVVKPTKKAKAKGSKKRAAKRR